MNSGVGRNRVETAREQQKTFVESRDLLSHLYHWVRSWDGGQFIALLLTVFAVAPLAYPGFFQSFSGLLPIYNLYDLERQPDLSVIGWMPAVGRSFDPFRGSGVVPYFVAEVFRLSGFAAPQAIMFSYGLSFLLAAWAMYRWVRHWLGHDAALLAATIYTYLPYHLMVVYVRGDLADAWTLALLPLSFWTAHVLSRKSRKIFYLLLVIFIFILFCATNLGLALFALPVLLGYVWVAGGLNRTWGIIGVILSLVVVTAIAYGWAGYYSSPVSFDDHFPYLFQLFSPSWNVDGHARGWLNGIPLQIGLAALGLGLLSVVLLWLTAKARQPLPAEIQPPRPMEDYREDPQGYRRLLWYWLAVAIISCLLVFAPSRWIWSATGWKYLLTYPWQVMAFLGLSLAVLGSSIIALDSRLRTVLVQAGLVTFVVLASYNYLVPRFFDFNINFTPEEEIEHTYLMTPRQAPLAIFGDNQVALLDFRLEGPLRHGATVRVNTLWQALRPLDEDYKIFIHAIDDEDNIWGQRDQEPLNGEYPTSEWGQGEIVADRYEFQIGLDGPREGYHLAIGMYRSDTGERLPLTNRRTRLVIQGEQ